MSTLRISDAPLLPDVDGTEKIPTGGRGDYAISVNQIKDHIFQNVGKELVGLGNVDNTSDLDKPVSTAQQAVLDLKADKTYVNTNLDLKADKTSVYTRSETSLAFSKKADLVNGVIPENQIPSSFNDVLEFTTSTLPFVGESGKIYITTDNNKTWRWGGNKYVEISNGGISDSTLKLQTPRKIANVDFDGTQNIEIPHNNLTNRNVANAHSANSISTATGESQQEINDYNGAKWHNKVGGYGLNARVMLQNGDIVKSTVAGNTTNPNENMSGWVYVNDAEISKHAAYVPNGGGSIGVIGGTFRGYSGGVQFVSDSSHAPIGTTGISKADTYTVRIDHAFGAAKVGAMNLTADEAFAAMGVISGASVAQNYSLAKVIAPLYVTIKGDGTITKVSPLFEGSVAVMAGNNPAGGILRFSHPLKSVTEHQAIAVNRSFADNVARPVNFGIFNNDGGTYTQINVYDDPPDNNVWVRYNNTSAAFEAAQGILKAQYSFSYNASTGGLTITHPTVKTSAYLTIPIITPFNTDKRYAVGSVSANTTTIVCYAPDGTVVKNLDVADWNFFFSIKPSSNERVLSAIPSTAEFTVFVGNCYVPVDNLQKVPGGNIWFYGAMNK